MGGSIAAVLCLGRPAIADPDPSQGNLSVSWDAPAICPDVAHVRAEVASMLQGSTPESHVAQLAARGTVTLVEGRFQLRIQLDSRGASETKAMDAATCDTLADAFALVVAFTFDPSVGRRRPPAAAAPGSASAVAVTPRPEPPAPWHEPSAPSTEGPPTRLLAGPLIALGAGALPFPAYGLGGRIAIESGARWELAGMIWPKEPTAPVVVDPSHTVGADVWLASLAPSACLSFVRDAVDACGGGEVGALRARGSGVPVSGSGTSWWLALTAGLSVRAPVTPGFGLRFRLDVGVPIYRPSFMLEDVGSQGSVQTFRPGPVAGALSFEPEVRLFSTDRTAARHDPR
jgi:hypothetical protein